MHMQRALQKLTETFIFLEKTNGYLSRMRDTLIGGETKPRNQSYLSISNGMLETGGGEASLITGEAPEAASDDDDGGDGDGDPDPCNPSITPASPIPKALRTVGASIKAFNAYPPLEQITAPTVATAPAAHYLNRQQQTLRMWACKQNGAIQPIRINGRLAWRVSDIKRVLGVA